MTKVTIHLSGEQEPRTVEFSGSTGVDLLAEIGVSVDAVLLLRGGQPIADDEMLSDGDEIDVIVVTSGG